MMNNERQAGTKAATLMMHKFKRPASFFAMLLLCAVLSTQAQNKDTNRYYQAMFYGIDTEGNLKYGTYFFSMKNSYFPMKSEVNKIIIDGYKLKFAYDSKELSVIITEFKNKYDFMKWNVK